MSYHFKILNCFKKQLKNYRKKFPSITNDVLFHLNNYEKEKATSLGLNNYKSRIKSSDLQKGKRSGFRMIIHIIKNDEILMPIAIYLKSDKENISKKEINSALKRAVQELSARS